MPLARDPTGSRALPGPLGPVRLDASTLVVIPPHRVHACNPVDDRWSYQMLHVDESRLAESLPELAAETARPVRILDRPGPYAAFCHLNAVLFSGTDPRGEGGTTRRCPRRYPHRSRSSHHRCRSR
ncbi:AraC family ligand binding domain-containing protein [Nocardia carnea]|uniref:AraC family ligand binding domain-containing protein n=1 Tax=Nocardia carnea TaxID=37328 RepID=UPI003D77BF3B